MYKQFKMLVKSHQQDYYKYFFGNTPEEAYTGENKPPRPLEETSPKNINELLKAVKEIEKEISSLRTFLMLRIAKENALPNGLKDTIKRSVAIEIENLNELLDTYLAKVTAINELLAG